LAGYIAYAEYEHTLNVLLYGTLADGTGKIRRPKLAFRWSKATLKSLKVTVATVECLAANRAA